MVPTEDWVKLLLGVPRSSARRSPEKGACAQGERMRSWGRTAEKESSARSVARAAVEGASRLELLRVAVKHLAGERTADRIGVWLQMEPGISARSDRPGMLQGFVWDAENSETPPEWAHLSVEAPLPEDLVLGGKSVEQDLEGASHRQLIGPLVGLRRVTWTPIERDGQLIGVILVGIRGRQVLMPRERAESVAAELTLALRLEEKEREAQAKKADIGLARVVLGAPASDHRVEANLQLVADSCTCTGGEESGPRATFAVIGVLLDGAERYSREVPVEFRWKSGDAEWTRAIESQPLESLWRKALEERRVIGGEPPGARSQEAVARIVAFPLESEGELLGTLVAGLSSHVTSLANFERLEWRAALAAAALGKRRWKEVELRHAEWQRALLDTSREPMVVLDQTGGIISVSRGARELAGTASPREKSGQATVPARQQFQELFRAPHLERIEKWLRLALAGEPLASEPMERFPEVELQNGLRVRLYVAASMRGGNLKIGLEPLSSVETPPFGDRAETELHSVLEWLEEGVVLFDAQENIRVMNTRFQQIAGLDPQESATIKTLEDLIGRLGGQAAEPWQFAESWRQLARGIEGGVREELRMVRPAPHTLERAARPVLDVIGRRLGRVEIYRDLTAQRIFQSKLLQTEKLVALGQMVSGIAHELSNPLTSILGNAQRLLLRRDSSGDSEDARRIFQEAERASAILRQLLLNARETLPERRLVSLNQIILRATDLQRFALEAEKIHLEIDLDPVLPFVQGDPGQLQQVLINLVGNAQQAIKQQGGGGVIRLRTRKIGEQRLLLEVEDTGPGIPQAILARIFDPFFTTKPAGVGTGLGLAIVLSVVREHGGQVRVKNSPQGGAIFQIELPAAAGVPQEKEAMKFESQRKDREIAATGQLGEIGIRTVPQPGSARAARVLVVEDEPTVARLIGDVLEDEGMNVDVLLDGREALDRAGRQHYDLVICDMRMPGLDGQHFYKSLVRTGNPLRKRFLFVTGDIVAAQTREFLEKNHLPHVAKPFRVEELTEKVHLVLESLPPREPASAGAERKNAAGNG
jgi:signal transduction histidine kinase/CheY-like chemotaxis protein